MSLLHHDVRREAFAAASHFRDDFFDCLTVRGDALFELTDALLCADGPVTTPVDLTLTAEHRRGHGAMYDALNSGNVDVPRLRQVLAGLPQPKAADGRLVLAVDVTHWLRPDAQTSADRLFCHVYGRSGRSSDQFVPGWPYSFVAALEPGRTSWCQILDALRLGPADDVAEVTAAQVRRVVEDLIDMGRWRQGDRDILIVFDAGYDAPRMAYLLQGLPVEVLGRMRTDRVMRKPVPVPWISPPQGGRPAKHGKESPFAKPDTWGEPDAATVPAPGGVRVPLERPCHAARYPAALATCADRLEQDSPMTTPPPPITDPSALTCPGDKIGPCANCQRKTYKYGSGGSPLCQWCMGIFGNGSDRDSVNDLGTAAGCRRIGLTSQPRCRSGTSSARPSARCFTRHGARCRRLDALWFRSSSAGERRITDEGVAFGRMGA
ncbi:hypothetical protein GCM10010121_092640 [Streptomyces brasiliensis]|uniref:Transposase IS701-like DDE domain-containing protein n=1 Tax=Streptomyces brasiliensis TaxID=1954 RepID=A0A917P984_9ACTN|nr:hypothetical protein GCM10010121_092640 [Streptomyces brasiliensis]